MLVHGVKGVRVWDRAHGTGQHPQHCQHHPHDADGAGEGGGPYPSSDPRSFYDSSSSENEASRAKDLKSCGKTEKGGTTKIQTGSRWSVWYVVCGVPSGVSARWDAEW